MDEGGAARHAPGCGEATDAAPELTPRRPSPASRQRARLALYLRLSLPRAAPTGHGAPPAGLAAAPDARPYIINVLPRLKRI